MTSKKTLDWIKNIVDQSLLKMSSSSSPWAMMTPGHVPAEMIDNPKLVDAEYLKWKPIPSTITDEELNQFENKIGFKLPLSYRTFLQYKHFVKLYLPNRTINLPANMPSTRLKPLEDYIFNYYDPELIIGKGYIYFADFEDYALLCFDTNQKCADYEYPIVYIFHEELDDIQPYVASFRELITSDEEHGNRFIDYLNEISP